MSLSLTCFASASSAMTSWHTSHTYLGWHCSAASFLRSRVPTKVEYLTHRVFFAFLSRPAPPSAPAGAESRCLDESRGLICLRVCPDRHTLNLPVQPWARLSSALAQAALQSLCARARSSRLRSPGHVQLITSNLEVGIDSLRSLATSQPACIANGDCTALLPCFPIGRHRRLGFLMKRRQALAWCLLACCFPTTTKQNSDPNKTEKRKMPPTSVKPHILLTRNTHPAKVRYPIGGGEPREKTALRPFYKNCSSSSYVHVYVRVV